MKMARVAFLFLTLAGCAASEPVMCTMEAKQCRDGSYVGRDPAADCAFRPCPATR